ncbi:MAG: tetratricopeptide repeat protein [Candidatus Hodarchaeales archaeon]
MAQVESLKEISSLVILSLVTFLVFIIFNIEIESHFSIVALWVFGIFLSIVIYLKGLKGIGVPREATVEERDKNDIYFNVEQWSHIDTKKGQLMLRAVLFLIILVIVQSLVINASSRLVELMPNEVISRLEFLSSNTWMIFFGLVFLIYSIILVLYLTKRVPEDLAKIFHDRMNRAVILIGISIYLIVGIILAVREIYSFESVFMGLFILPIALVVARIEGQFFYLFTINQWNQIRNYDILRGQKLVNNEDSLFRQMKGRIKQFIAFMALVIIPISLVSTLLHIIDFISGAVAGSNSSMLNTVIGSFTSAIPDLAPLILVLFTLGPLLVLIVRPFAFVETWINQGLYSKISSPWDLDTLKNNMDSYNALFNMPYKYKSFRWSMFLSSVSILTLIGLNIFVSFTVLDQAIITHIKESILLLSFITSIVFILTILELSLDPIEEKTLLLFGRESRKTGLDLINYSLYGEYLLYKSENMDEYIKKCPEHWGLPYFLKGLNVRYNIEDRLKAFEKALDEKSVLLKSIEPIAWNDYGAILAKLGRNEEALRAFMKGEEALGKKQEEILKELDDTRMSPDFLVEVPVVQTLADPLYVQTAIDGTGGSSATNQRESNLLSYEELVGYENKEKLTSFLERKYERRANSKLARNINFLMKQKEEIKKNWEIIKSLDEHLKDNPNDAESWAKLGNICKKLRFTKRAKESFEKASQLFQVQERQEERDRILKELEEL